MKKTSIFLLLPIILFLLAGCSNNENNNSSISSLSEDNKNNQSNIQNSTAKRVTVPIDANNTANNISNNIITNSTNTTNNTNITNTNNTTNTDNTTNTTANNSNNSKTSEPAEVELSSFSTDILTSDPNRNNNIQITCGVLNEHIVAPGETFSFTGLVGKSTYDKGYKQANVISNDGETIKGLGGGNCQVSSTLYNAVAAVPELEVIERHNHGAEVYYVPIGQDAAVAHGSIDFKFKNNLSSNIKIYASSDDKVITTSIVKVNQK